VRAVVLALGLLLFAAGCGNAASGDTSDGSRLRVVVAENMWGSLAAQLVGREGDVTIIVSSPNADPHDYEPTAADARSLAGANLVLVNGIGYDPWASKLIAANPVDGRVVLDVGKLLGLSSGANPHRWYSPQDVQRVIRATAGDYKRIEPGAAAYFDERETKLETSGLARYRRLIATIRKRYRGVPVGASESIVQPLAQALGLKLVTPPSFLRAISEGTEPTAGNRTTIDRQLARKQIAVWIVNTQNSTPDVARITAAARKRGIPVVSVTETPVPASASFQSWQTRQLRALAVALAKATNR
jgi:zinc/manganese transport system substrate-binding protein